MAQGEGWGSSIPMSNWDATYTKVFVGGLAWETQSQTLGRYFQQFGPILEAVVITDKNTGRSKGYGFVTFCDPESARRACADPSPLIDGRRANCNLASLGRPPTSMSSGRHRPENPFVRSVQMPRGPYVGAPSNQQPVPYIYPPRFLYPPYGSTTYGPEYAYPQNVYNPYMDQHYLHMYGAPGRANTGIYSYGSRGFTTVQGYTMPGHSIVQLSGPNVNRATTSTIPAIEAPRPADQTQTTVPTHSPQSTHGSSSDQTAD